MSKTGIYVQQQARRNAADWIETYARIGIAAKGVVYVLIGVLAAMTVFGAGGENNGKNGAFRTILEQPFGKILLGIVIIGLLGYVGWRMIQAFKDPERNGDDTKGITKRTGFFISGLVYLFLAFSALRLLLPSLSNGSSGGGRQLLVAKMLQQPFGQWLVGIAAVIIIGKGIFQLYKAYTGKFKNKIKKHEMSREEKATFMRAGRIGYTARGIVLGIIGYFLLRAALQSDASEAQGTEGALNFLSTTGGPYLMAAVAIGLACYGIFMFVKSKYRYMPDVTP
ncbi:DUF1206 domain-containing protein [Nafulsella turpanensis]|uniref:DUF1206 domain-containing protein n=1 Tax=Nafulsella turpanensis TaxID=1265690 RepID=UPI00034CC1B6|nr:DUF1206 domain-containing protein [Nafulsella turpanensis]